MRTVCRRRRSGLARKLHHIGHRITQPSDPVQGAGRFVAGFACDGATGLEVTEFDLQLDPYTLLDLRFGVSRGGWEAELHAGNLTDENAALSFDRERGGRAGWPRQSAAHDCMFVVNAFELTMDDDEGESSGSR